MKTQMHHLAVLPWGNKLHIALYANTAPNTDPAGASVLGEINSSVYISLSINSHTGKVTPYLLPLSFHLKLNNNCFGVWSPAEARAHGLETALMWLVSSGPGLVTMPTGKVEQEQDSKMGEGTGWGVFTCSWRSPA